MKRIEEIKREVKADLDAASSTPQGRLEVIFARIKDCEGRPGPEARLRIVILTISALVHHERHGGLPPPQLRHLVELAHAIFGLVGGRREHSSVGLLSGELHLALSQIHRKEGRHWQAMWEHHVSQTVARVHQPGGAAFQALVLGQRAQRLGHLSRAITEFAAAQLGELGELPKASREQARIGQIRALRLAARPREAEALIVETLAGFEPTDRLRHEMAWERLCIECTRDGTLAPMIVAVQRKGSHAQASYMVEAYFWAFGHRDPRWLERLTKMRTLARNPEAKARGLGAFFDAALKLETLLEDATPVTLRVNVLGGLLAEAGTLTAIDRELLLFLAATRWLARQRMFKLAATCLWEYRGHSLKLSDGASGDVLGAADDLLSRSWFRQGLSDDVDSAGPPSVGVG